MSDLTSVVLRAASETPTTVSGPASGLPGEA